MATYSSFRPQTQNLVISGNTTLGDASGDTVTFNSSTAAIPNGLNFDSNTLVIDAGNNKIGIGTNSPSQQLTLTGSQLFNNNQEIRFKDSGGTERTAISLDSSNDLNIGTSANGNLRFINGSSYTERMRINASGNLLVGTTTPLGTVTVVSGTFGAPTDSAQVLGAGNVENVRFMGYNSSANQSGLALLAGASGSAAVGLFGLKTGTNQAAFAIRMDTGSGTSAERLRIDSSGNLLIGTTDATSSNGNLGKLLKIGSSNNNVLIFETSTSDRNGIIEGRKTSRSGNARYSQIGLINDSSDNGLITFYTAPSGSDVTERMRITSGGSVLNGTTVDIAWGNGGYAISDKAGSFKSSPRGIFTSQTNVLSGVSNSPVTLFTITEEVSCYLLSIYGITDDNALSSAVYVFTSGAYDRRLVQIGQTSNHFGGGAISASLSSSSAFSVDIRVQFSRVANTNVRGSLLRLL